MFKILFFFFITMNVCATERPPVLKNFIDSNETDNRVTVVKNLSAEEKAFFWKNTKINDNGVILKNNPLDAQLTSIDRMFINSNKKINKSSKIFKYISKTFDSNNIISELPDSENRITYFIKMPSGIAMLTIHDLAADDYKVTVIADFMNVKINGNDATIVLINGEEKSNKRRWVLGWFVKDIAYDLQIPDEILANGKTKLTKDDVLEFAKKITRP